MSNTLRIKPDLEKSGEIPIQISILNVNNKGYLLIDKWCYPITVYSQTRYRLTPLDSFNLLSMDSNIVSIGDAYWLWKDVYRVSKIQDLYFEFDIIELSENSIDIKIKTMFRSVYDSSQEYIYGKLMEKLTHIDRKTGIMIVEDKVKLGGNELIDLLDGIRDVEVKPIDVSDVLKELVFG